MLIGTRHNHIVTSTSRYVFTVCQSHQIAIAHEGLKGTDERQKYQNHEYKHCVHFEF